MWRGLARALDQPQRYPPMEPSDRGPGGVEHQVVHIESAVGNPHYERDHYLTELNAKRHSEPN